MCSFIVVHERSITKCDLINNIIKTILPRSIGLFYHASKQAWQTGVLIQCRYGLSSVILFIFLIIFNIWIYYAITFCRFTYGFYILMAKQTNRRKRAIKTILPRSIGLFLFFCEFMALFRCRSFFFPIIS
jgi:hypothetical protein